MEEEFFRLNKMPEIKEGEELEAKVIKAVVLRESNKSPDERTYCSDHYPCKCDGHVICSCNRMYKC